MTPSVAVTLRLKNTAVAPLKVTKKMENLSSFVIGPSSPGVKLKSPDVLGNKY